jgi:hypothetical protein
MSGEENPRPRRSIRPFTSDRDRGDPIQWAIVDLDGSLANDVLGLRTRLALLAEERLSAREAGLINDRAYVEDLDMEVAETSFVHDAAVVLRLVVLRGELDGRGQG